MLTCAVTLLSRNTKKLLTSLLPSSFYLYWFWSWLQFLFEAIKLSIPLYFRSHFAVLILALYNTLCCMLVRCPLGPYVEGICARITWPYEEKVSNYVPISLSTDARLIAVRTPDPREGLSCPTPENGQFSHPKFCDKYLSCWDGELVVVGQCPNGLVFNPKINGCDYPRNVDCGDRPVSRKENKHAICSKQESCRNLKGLNRRKLITLLMVYL